MKIHYKKKQIDKSIIDITIYMLFGGIPDQFMSKIRIESKKEKKKN